MPLENLARYLKGLYPLGVMLAVAPLVDIVIRMTPMLPGELTWRFGTSILLLGNSAIMLTGLGLIGAIAALTGNATVLRALSVVAGVGAVLAIALIAMYMLDSTQIRAATPPQGQRDAFRGILSGANTATFAIASLIGLCVASWRAGSGIAARDARVQTRRPSGVVEPRASTA